jgi:hypothetical protein
LYELVWVWIEFCLVIFLFSPVDLFKSLLES